MVRAGLAERREGVSSAGGVGTMIQLSEVHKSFGDNHVLRGVDLSVRRGETMAVMGTSGCGKSVLLHLLIGLLRPDEGRIVIDGENVSSFTSEDEWEKVRLKTGFLFQGGALYDSMTVGENIAFSLRHHTKLSRSEIEERVKEKLQLVHLSGVEERYPSELSGGMQKRVALARTIALNPKIVLYDEPTTGLDPVASRWISHLIRRLQEELAVTSVVVTHERDLIFHVADRIAMLHDGKIVAVGTAPEVRQSDNPCVRQFLSGSMEGPIR